MRIKKEDYEKLKVEKGAQKISVMFSTIYKIIREYERELESAGEGWDYKKLEDAKEKLNGNIYADKIELRISGNEPRVYAFIYDNNGREIYHCSFLNDDEEAFMKVTRCARAFMEAFNLYIYFNFD